MRRNDEIGDRKVQSASKMSRANRAAHVFTRTFSLESMESRLVAYFLCSPRPTRRTGPTAPALICGSYGRARGVRPYLSASAQRQSGFLGFSGRGQFWSQGKNIMTLSSTPGTLGVHGRWCQVAQIASECGDQHRHGWRWAWWLYPDQ